MIVSGPIRTVASASFKRLVCGGQFTQIIRNMSMVTFESENKAGNCPGYFQGKDKKTKKGLIVLQEWWGLNDQIKDEAKHIGDLGNFMTLAPDLYRGKIATESETAGHLMKELDWPGAIQDIRGAAKFLMKEGCTKVGVTGFCMGGALSFAAAVQVKEISAAAPFYGIPDQEAFPATEITIPVQAHFGGSDTLTGFSSPEDATALEEKMKDKKNFELLMYEGCGHAFTNPTGPLDNYNKDACDLAFKRMVTFMNEHLE